MKLIQAKNCIQWMKISCLYYRAFPVSERKPLSMIRKMQKKGVSDVWYLEQDGQFVGLVITINGPDLILIDYLAIHEKRRGRGDGSQALKSLREKYVGKGIFLEIEQVCEAAENYEERRSRKQFYLSNGLQEMHTTAKLFGVEMELLGYDCHLDFDQYRAFYRDNYNEWAASHVERLEA